MAIRNGLLSRAKCLFALAIYSRYQRVPLTLSRVEAINAVCDALSRLNAECVHHGSIVYRLGACAVIGASEMAAKDPPQATPMPASSCISRPAVSTAMAAPGRAGAYNREAPSLKQQLRNPTGDRPAYAEAVRSEKGSRRHRPVPAGAAGPARRDGLHDPKRLNAVASGHGFSAGHTLESLQTVIGKTLPRGLCSGMAWGRAASLGLQSEPVRWIGRRLYGEAQYQWRYA
jgi:hypothetical protein